EADRLVAEEVRLAAEAEVHRPEFRETPDLREDAGEVPELRLPVHRLDAERATLVDVPHAPFRRVELDRQRIGEVRMGPHHVRPEEGPTVPLLHGLVAVRPLARRQLVVPGGVEVPKGDPVEGLDQGIVVISEARERAPEDPRAFEARRVVDDLLLADRQAPQVLAGEIGPERTTRRSPRSGWPARARSIVTYSHVWPASRIAPAAYRGYGEMYGGTPKFDGSSTYPSRITTFMGRHRCLGPDKRASPTGL